MDIYIRVCGRSTYRQTKCGSDDVKLDIVREKKWRKIADTEVKKGKGGRIWKGGGGRVGEP